MKEIDLLRTNSFGFLKSLCLCFACLPVQAAIINYTVEGVFTEPDLTPFNFQSLLASYNKYNIEVDSTYVFSFQIDSSRAGYGEEFFNGQPEPIITEAPREFSVSISGFDNVDGSSGFAEILNNDIDLSSSIFGSNNYYENVDFLASLSSGIDSFTWGQVRVGNLLVFVQ